MQAMVRVELHHASPATYQLLHSAMAAAGFSRTLTASSNGTRSHMPTGTYWTEMSADPWVILEAAKKAALSVAPNAEVVVAANGEIVYFQCPPVLMPAAPKPLGSLASVPLLRIGANNSSVATPVGLGSGLPRSLYGTLPRSK
jgi:hypothetical protein